MSGEEGSRRLPVFLPWLALVGGAAMSMLLNSRGSLLPGWLMGALLLFFVRQQRPGVSFVSILCVNTLATGLVNIPERRVRAGAKAAEVEVPDFEWVRRLSR